MPSFEDYLVNIGNPQVCQLLKNVWERYLVNIDNSDFVSCFECYEFLLDNCPRIIDYLENDMLELLSKWSDFVVTNNRDDQMGTLMQAHVTAVRYCRSADAVFNSCGKMFFRQKKFLDAKIYFEESMKLNSHNLEVKENIDNLNSMLMNRWHFPMLNDKSRNFGFRDAIRRGIRGLKMEGSKFACLDIGAGTGLLSMYITSAVDEFFESTPDAVKVISCELEECMFKVAEEVLKLNELNGRIQLIHSSSNDFNELPYNQDNVKLAMVVTETFDAGLFGEGVLESMDHVHRMLKTPDVNLKVIPKAATAYMCLVESEDIRNYSRYQGQNKYFSSEGIRIFCNVGQADNDEIPWQPYTCEKMSSLKKMWRWLSEPVALDTIDFESHEDIRSRLVGATTNFPIKVIDGGSLDAMVMWFDLHLDDECDVTTSPFNHKGQSSCWQQAVYPIFNIAGQRDLSIENGDIVNVECCVKGLIHLKFVGVDSSSMPSLSSLALSSPSLSSLALSSPENIITYHIPPRSIAFLNDSNYHDKCLEALERLFSDRGQNSVGLVINSRPGSQSGLIMAFWCLRNGVKVKFIISEDDNKDYDDDDDASAVEKSSKLLKDLLMLEGHAANLISFRHISHDDGSMSDDDDSGMSVDDDAERIDKDDDGVKWMAGFIDFIESSGSMRSSSFTNLSNLRRYLSIGHKMMPSKIHCMGVLIDSESIVSDSCVVSDESTSPYKVAEVINRFKTSYHINFHLDSTPHTKLTSPLHLFTFDTSDNNHADNPFIKKCSLKVQSIADGTITALVYWFRVELMDGLIVDTLNGHWKQSSVILNPVHVSKSHEYLVDVGYRSGYFNVHVT